MIYTAEQSGGYRWDRFLASALVGERELLVHNWWKRPMVAVWEAQGIKVTTTTTTTNWETSTRSSLESRLEIWRDAPFFVLLKLLSAQQVNIEVGPSSHCGRSRARALSIRHSPHNRYQEMVVGQSHYHSTHCSTVLFRGEFVAISSTAPVLCIPMARS